MLGNVKRVNKIGSKSRPAANHSSGVQSQHPVRYVKWTWDDVDLTAFGRISLEYPKRSFQWYSLSGIYFSRSFHPLVVMPNKIWIAQSAFYTQFLGRFNQLIIGEIMIRDKLIDRPAIFRSSAEAILWAQSQLSLFIVCFPKVRRFARIQIVVPGRSLNEPHCIRFHVQ